MGITLLTGIGVISVNALNRAFLISTISEAVEMVDNDSVNALNRAFLISTEPEEPEEPTPTVSMPLIGLSSFLL